MTNQQKCHFCLTFGFVFIRMRCWESWNFRILCIQKAEVCAQTIIQNSVYQKSRGLRTECRISKGSVVLLHRQGFCSLHKKEKKKVKSIPMEFFTMTYNYIEYTFQKQQAKTNCQIPIFPLVFLFNSDMYTHYTM